ncbi:hypothetical protein C6A87_001295 [Mycobacterium sp. ITM-2016-00317]|uniref:hypothetical protein n=1 Tax=Mycobacterium sp. ITM-2016-00317 TaxID=2099694 RepID=UPI00287F40F0|nr:hypothetical protein [Mycobacterium sp. ITM-2016-00317]WNG87948.1 hypothetical protein C6A87_001295 [Mycobacterium sp. ITM-2016-00317]
MTEGTTAESVTGLERFVADWHPQPVSTTDAMDARRATELAATLDLDVVPQPGDELPTMWQWVYFTEFPPTAELGVDGHPRDGHFLPPIPHRRRMFAGARLTVHSPLVLGRPATRHAEVLSTKVKHGKTGELLFVTVGYRYEQDGEHRLTEEHDLVYRSEAESSTSFTRVTEPLAPQDAPWSACPTTGPVLLFRFSALTANAHRIHYDEAYTTGVEGFPALVVHGPLLALYMSELARARSERPLTGFQFRLMRPVFVGDVFRAQGTPDADGSAAELSLVSGAGNLHATARATFG